MQSIRRCRSIWGALILIGLVAGLRASPQKTSLLTLVMCHPTKTQIQNIMELRRQGFFGDEEMRLIGVYHQDEATDFTPAREFVNKSNLAWIEFAAVRERAEHGAMNAGKQWIPFFRRLVRRAHGVLFTGGSDIPPATYGQTHMLLTDADTPLRSDLELSFLRFLLGDPKRPDCPGWLENEKDFPVLAVCLGAQTLNISLGGSLWQDIPWEVYGLRTVEAVLAQNHDRIHSSRYTSMLHPGIEDLIPHLHALRWCREGHWLKCLPAAAKPIVVLSNHHQAIREVAADLVVAAVSMDGRVVEAIAHRRFQNVLGVQFHPEVAALYQADKLYRPAPGEKRSVSLVTILARHPGSQAFHRQLWLWFYQAMREIRNQRQEVSGTPDN